MPRKLIKPLTLSQLQERYNRPADITRMSVEEMTKYYSNIARAANSRLNALEKFSEKTGLTMYTADDFIFKMQSSRRGGEGNVTLANRLRLPGSSSFFGTRNRGELLRMIKTTEEFLRNKQSTVTGVRERYASTVDWLSSRFDLNISEEEAGAISEVGMRAGLSTDGWYEILKTISEPAAQGVAEDDYNDFIRYIDTHVAMVDDDLEPILRRLYESR